MNFLETIGAFTIGILGFASLFWILSVLRTIFLNKRSLEEEILEWRVNYAKERQRVIQLEEHLRNQFETEFNAKDE